VSGPLIIVRRDLPLVASRETGTASTRPAIPIEPGHHTQWWADLTFPVTVTMLMVSDSWPD